MQHTVVNVPLTAHRTREGWNILRPSNDYEYDGTALLKAKTLLAFFNVYSWLEMIDMEINDCVVVSIGFNDGSSVFHKSDIGKFVSICVEMEKNPEVVAVIPTVRFGQRYEQPGYVVLKKDYVDTFFDVFLKTSVSWLENNPETTKQLMQLFQVQATV